MGENATSRLAYCTLCDGNCLARVTVENNRITQVAPPEAEIGGGICVKGAALKTYVHAPERIDTPMRRVGEKGSGCFESITWEEAFAEIAARMNRVKEEDGAQATAFFVGHPKWMRYMVASLAIDYGSPNYLTESSTCYTAGEIAHKLVYGCPPKMGGGARSKTVICWGANPASSQGANNGKLLSARERGTKLIVVDPRRTPMSERADIHLAIRPGTDGALALAMANVILANGWEDRAFLNEYAVGVEEFEALVADMPPEKAAVICGVEADLIRQAAELFATNGPASIITTACGIAHSPNSVQNLRAVYLLTALTGNYAPGDGWMLNGFHHAAPARVNVEKEHNGGAFPVWNELIGNEGQSIDMDKAILEGRIRNLIAFGMNRRMFPRADRMGQALRQCEFFVDVDVYMTDAARWADIVLPCTTGPERELVHRLADDRIVYVPAAIDPGQRRNDVEIIMGLCEALGLKGEMTGMRSFDEYMEWMLKPAGVTLAQVKACPEGIPACPKQESKPAGMRFGTPSGKVEFHSSVLEKHGFDPLPVYREYAGMNPDSEQFPLILCAGGRQAWFFQSRTFHLPWLAGLVPHPTVTLSPEDAARLGIADMDAVRLTTPVGSMVLTAQVSPNVQAGQVFVLHDDEQNINDIIDSDYRDPISGFPCYRTYFCRVEKEADVCE